MNWTIDECPDANGFWTIRISDGTPNGDIDSQPIATVYTLEDAERIVQSMNQQGEMDSIEREEQNRMFLKFSPPSDSEGDCC